MTARPRIAAFGLVAIFAVAACSGAASEPSDAPG